MQFGKTLGEACATFSVTNVDDMFVLITFFAEASTSNVLTPVKIILGQYIGFTIIVAVSMIGFGVSLVLPPEPIGFLGILPILLGIWKFCGLFHPDTDDETSHGAAATMKGVFKVALITLMNGGDNIGTYIPLFSQVERAEIAIYVVVYYILLGFWCLAAFLVMRQKHILSLVQKSVDYILPLLYAGLGVFIIVKSDCYPWTIAEIDKSTASDPGKGTMAGVTTFILLVAMCGMAWSTVAKRKSMTSQDVDLASEHIQMPTLATTRTSLNSRNPGLSERQPGSDHEGSIVQGA